MWYDEGGSVAMITASLDADVSAHDGTLREEFPPLHSIVPASRPVTIAACGVLRVGRFVSRHCATLRATGPIVLMLEPSDIVVYAFISRMRWLSLIPIGR
ncbi:hypothetical protein AcV5_008932 [Taiwanofungus camphoratus]|nr:hypothetical protein AcV5_008932 [Antrodia cinnamomea]